jgi:hypothetical protein
MNGSALNHNHFRNLNLTTRVGGGRIKHKIKKVGAALLGWIGSLVLLSAQTPGQPDPLMQLMLTQPAIEISTNIEVQATFDPPVIQPRQKSTYRVTFNAVSDSIKWPDDIYAPMELTLKRSARGQILQSTGAKLRPLTTINHHVTATTTGGFTVPEFKVKVYGRNVTVPAARLEVVSPNDPVPPPPLRLYLELGETNAYCGQPVNVRVLMPAAVGNALQVLNQVQVNGDGILLDQTAVRQRIQPVDFNGRSVPAFIYETVITPLVAGRIDLTAQAFTAGNQFSGSIVIQGQTTIPGGPPQYVLLDSDVVSFNVEPLPRTGLLPGFNGAIGQFTADSPQLSTNTVRVGDVVKVFVTFRSAGNLKRVVAPPPPGVTNWQIFPAVPDTAPRAPTNPAAGNFVSFSYSLIPLTNSMTTTPEIPFSYFDPERKTYVDLTIPPLPIKVVAGLATAEAQALAQAAAATTNNIKLKLSGLASAPGRTATSLIPLQLRGGFLWAQVVPLVGFTGLWFWDRRRRFFALHPEILVRRRAKRALRRERVALQKAAQAGDATRFANVAVNALRVACAPHFPASPRALVGRDVLELFEDNARHGRTGEVVRQFFSVTDATQFSPSAAETSALLSLQPELNVVLDELEARL